MVAPVPPTSEKFDVATPVTDAANVTVQLTDVLIQAGLVEARLIELTVVPAAVLVRLKLTPVVTPRALAVTVYGPPVVPLAVTVPVVAAPLAIVTGVPATVQLAPLAGGENLTCPPLTGSLLALLTVTDSGVAKFVFTAVLWLFPFETAMVKPRDSNAPMSVVPTRLIPR
jgi:hypothetical protein